MTVKRTNMLTIATTLSRTILCRELLLTSLSLSSVSALSPRLAADASTVPVTDAARPMYSGPHADFVPARNGTRLVDDLRPMRKLWQRDEHERVVNKTPKWPVLSCDSPRL